MVHPYAVPLRSVPHNHRLRPGPRARPYDLRLTGAVRPSLAPGRELVSVLDVKLLIGSIDVPRGEYTLFMLSLADGAELILGRGTRQWGTDYDPSWDFEKTRLGRRAVAETVENLTVTLQPDVPAEGGDVPSGMLRIAWGKTEYFTRWRMLWS